MSTLPDRGASLLLSTICRTARVFGVLSTFHGRPRSTVGQARAGTMKVDDDIPCKDAIAAAECADSLYVS